MNVSILARQTNTKQLELQNTMRHTSSSSSCPLPSSCLHGHGHGHGHVKATLVVIMSLVVVSLVVVVALGPRTQTSWFLSFPSSPKNNLVYSSSSMQPTGRGSSALLATSSPYHSNGVGGGGKKSSRKGVHVEVLQSDHDGLEVLINSSSGYGRRHVSVAPEAEPIAAAAAAAAPAPAPEWGFSDRASPGVAVRLPKTRRRRDVKLERVELSLAKARSAIRDAIQHKGNQPPLSDKDYVPVGPVYRNAYAFHRSYLEMEKLFKVYVYEEGEPPVFHDGPCRSIYSSEGRFIYGMEAENRLRTRNPELAHAFFLPFSVVKMVQHIYEPNSHDMNPLRRTVLDYVNVLAGKYSYWNRSLGADHFMLSCHDWGPYVSSAHGHLYNNSIRVLCNANTSEGFNPSKDVSLPEINLRTDTLKGLVGGPSASRRPILAFFAGGNHGPVRPLLLEHWKGKDNDIQVSEYLRKGVSYINMMRQSKYCLCPSGYEVASPRIVEAIYVECVPVTIGDDYVLPFSDVLNWKSFSVHVSVNDIPNLKNILASISSRQYIRMQRRVRVVRQHFMVNSPPERYDVYHMILHSVWLRRLSVRVHAQD